MKKKTKRFIQHPTNIKVQQSVIKYEAVRSSLLHHCVSSSPEIKPEDKIAEICILQTVSADPCLLSSSGSRESSLYARPGSHGAAADPSMAGGGRAGRQHGSSFRAGPVEAAADAQQPAPPGSPSHQHPLHGLLHDGWCSQHAAEGWRAAAAAATPSPSTASSTTALRRRWSPVASPHLSFNLAAKDSEPQTIPQCDTETFFFRNVDIYKLLFIMIN